MNLLERVKQILLNPAAEWARIDQESPPVEPVAKGFLLPLLVLGSLAILIGQTVFGFSMFGVTIRPGFLSSLGSAVLNLVMGVAMTFVVAAIVAALAPTFGGQRLYPRAFALVAFGSTGALVGNLAALVPALSLIGLVGSLYSVYLLYKGLPVMMKSPANRTLPYFVLVVIASFVAALVVGWASSVLVRPATGLSTLGGKGDEISIRTPAGEITTTQGKLDEMSRKLEEASRRMEQAGKSGDGSGVAAGAAEAMRAITGAAPGGDRTPIGAAALKAWLPETWGGMKRTEFEVNDGAAAGIAGSTATARYGDGQRRLSLEIVDAGGAAAVLATIAGLHAGERETERTLERSYTQGKRKIMEKRQKDGSSAEITQVLANGVMVKAAGRGVSFETLAAALQTLDVGRLEQR